MNHMPKKALLASINDCYDALERLIPIPNVHTHNVALALDELIREAEATLAEMPEDVAK